MNVVRLLIILLALLTPPIGGYEGVCTHKPFSTVKEYAGYMSLPSMEILRGFSSMCWGGGQYYQDVRSECTRNSPWQGGCAWTGGNGAWLDVCGPRQYVVDLGKTVTLQAIAMTSETPDHDFKNLKLSISMDSPLNNFQLMEYYPSFGQYWKLQSVMSANGLDYTEISIAKVQFPKSFTGRFLKIESNNCDITHGWLRQLLIYPPPEQNQCILAEAPRAFVTSSVDSSSLLITQNVQLPSIPPNMRPSIDFSSSSPTNCKEMFVKTGVDTYQFKQPLHVFRNCTEMATGRKVVTTLETASNIILTNQVSVLIFCNEGFGEFPFQNQISFQQFSFARNLRPAGDTGINIEPQVVLIANDTASTTFATQACFQTEPNPNLGCLASIPYGLQLLYVKWKLLVDEIQSSQFQVTVLSGQVMKNGKEIELITSGLDSVAKNINKLPLSKPLNPGKYQININFYVSLAKARSMRSSAPIAPADATAKGTITFIFEINENRSWIMRIFDWIYQTLQELLM